MQRSKQFDVFVSYARADRARVDSLVHQLEQAGLRVWIDSEQVKPGESVTGRLQEGLASSRTCLVCLSPAFLKSPWCEAELESVLHAQIAGRDTRVIPVLIEEVAAKKIPPFLARLNPVDARTGPGIELLLNTLTDATEQPSRPTVTQEPPTEIRLFLRKKDSEIEAWWSTPDGQGEPFSFTSPIDKKDAETHRWYLEDFIRYPGAGDLARARGFKPTLVAWGEALLAAIKTGNGWQYLARLLDDRKPARLTLVSSDPEPLALPWELLRDPRSPLLARDLVIRRQLPSPAALPKRALGLPLRILLVVARPSDVGFIDPRSSTMPMLDALEPLEGNVTVEFCEPPTLGELNRRLDQARLHGKKVHIVHFDGHGVYLKKTGVGALCFENDRGDLDLIPGPRLGDLLAQMDIPVALLEACQTSDLATAPVFGSVAPALLKSGVGSVIAFSHSVLVVAARILVEALYESLCDGRSVGQALNRGRMALMAKAERRPSAEGKPLELHDWHISQLYQAGPDPVLVPGGAPRRSSGRPLQAGRRPDPAFGRKPLYGFHGRARELLELRRRLTRHTAVALTGMGGMGKTSLAREAAHWWTRTGHRMAGAAFFSFESRQGADRAVQAFGHYLEGDAFDRLSSDDRWQRAVELFHSHHVLWVWDNFESTLPAFQKGRATGTAFADEERQRLVRLYNELTDGKPRGWLLVTCRPAETGLPGIAEMELGSLSKAEALELATVILQRKDAPLGEPGWERDKVEHLLRVLRYHTLSLELVLPHLKKLQPDEVARDMSRLLERFTSSDAEEERNRGLLASLQFSTGQLSEDAREVLPWLGWFDGGAFELKIIELSEMDPERWAAVCHELLATALVEVDDEVQVGDRPFLRFHPTLAFAAAAELVADPDAARERFVAIYLALAGGVHKALRGSNPAGGMAVMEREEGNLRHAVELAFAGGEHQRGWRIADKVGIYLQMAGRVRDQARWAAWVRGEMERVAGPAGQPDEASLAATLDHAWGLFVEGRAEEAVDLLQGLIARLESSEGGDVSRQLALSNGYLGRLLLHAGLPSQALVPLGRAIIGFEAVEDWASLSAALGDQANALRALGRHEEALAAAERVLDSARDLGHQRSVAVSLDSCAQILRDMQRWGEAEQRYQEALEAARQARDPGIEGITLQHMGTLLRHRGRFPEAIARYREALGFFQRADDVAGEMQTCDLLGSAEILQNHFESARAWYERARELATRFGDRRQLAGTGQNLGILLRRQALALPETQEEERRELLKAAISLIEQSLKAWREMGRSVEAAASLCQLGILQMYLGDLDRAEEHLLESLQICESLNLPDVYKNYANLEQIAQARNDPTAAAEWRAKKEAKLAELERLRTQGTTPGLPPELAKAILAMARDTYQVRISGQAVPPDLAEALAAMQQAPAPLPGIATFLDTVAQGQPVPPIPPGLPEELGKILRSLVEAINNND